MYISTIANSKKLVKVKVIINKVIKWKSKKLVKAIINKEIQWISKKLVKINNKELNMYTSKACK